MSQLTTASMDGHIPSLPRPGTPPSNDKCILDLERCFGGFWTRNDNVTSADMFTRLTFQYPECGDCSGSNGSNPANDSDHGPYYGLWSSWIIGILTAQRDHLQESTQYDNASIPSSAASPSHSDLARSRLFSRERSLHDLTTRGRSRFETIHHEAAVAVSISIWWVGLVKQL